MKKLYGKKITAALLAAVMVMSCGTFAFADGGGEALQGAPETDSNVVVTLGEAKNITPPEAPKEKPAVMFNGEYIEFTDAKPVNLNGRIMVPFRAIFETMGAAVNYDNRTKEITAELDGKTVSFKAGSSELAVTSGGKTEKINMDTVPFTDAYTKRTYVPSRFAAEAFGYSVGWDNAYKTVVIIDFDPIINEVSEKMSIIGLLFDAGKVDVLRPYRTTGDFDIDLTLGTDAMKALKGETADVKPLNVTLGGKIDGTVQGKKGITNEMTADIGMVFDLNEKDIIKALEISDTAEGNLWELILSDLSVDIKMDGENIYIKAPALDYLMLGMAEDENAGAQGFSGLAGIAANAKNQDVWYKMPMSLVYDTYESMGVNFEQLLSMAQDVNSFESYLKMLAAMFTEMGDPDIDTYYELRIGASVLNALVGDEAFKTTGSGSTYTHTLNFDMTSFMELAKIVDEEDAAKEIVKELADAGVDFSINLTLRERNKSLDNYSVKMNIDAKDKFSLSADGSGNLNNTTARITMKIENYLDFTMKSSQRTENTSKAPDTVLPQAARIIDFAELMQQGGSREASGSGIL